jgi:hypothetical protein
VQATLILCVSGFGWAFSGLLSSLLSSLDCIIRQRLGLSFCSWAGYLEAISPLPLSQNQLVEFVVERILVVDSKTAESWQCVNNNEHD